MNKTEPPDGGGLSRFSETSEQVIAKVRAMSPRTLLSFSCGKDAIGAHLAIRDHFDEVVPYYLYLVPGLEFVDESLDYYERTLFGGRRIIRLPHPSLPRMLNALVFQPPDRVSVLDRLDMAEHDYKEVTDAIKAELGMGDEVLTASGVRAADSPLRYMHFKKRGAITWTKGQYYPVFDWNKARLAEAIERAGVKLPVDYRLFGRTFDGIDLRFLIQIREHFPRDFQRILDWFPLAELELYRYDKRAQA
ncbi:phosphoadenosine phosphosulfate reductase [Aquabacterium olei]|nr:phosphoadenosine phosphosulfate reductase [Aquabacterium olei]